MLVRPKIFDSFGIDLYIPVPWNELAIETLDRFCIAADRWTNTHVLIMVTADVTTQPLGAD